MTMSVVMATYNRRALLPQVLDPLLDDPAALEVVVVVDGCEDGSIEYLRERAESDHRLRPILIPNRGAVPAQQTGVEAARGDIVLVIDDDVLAEPGLVSGHLRHHEAESDLVVVGYMPTKRPERRAPGSFTSEVYHDVYEFRCREWEAQPDLILFGLWGGNVSVDRAALLANGGIGGRYELPYHYDWELGLRLHRAGLKGRFDRTLAAQHLHERSYGAFKGEARRQGRAVWLIEHLHGEVLSDGHIRDRLHARTRALPALLAATDRPRVYRLVHTLLDRGVQLAGRARVFALERKLGSLLGHVERRRGEYDQSRETPAPEPWQASPVTRPAGADSAL
jgi:glycosyltransferase involved in cell wall biosynthesis